jgi:hypothetical protein
MLLEQKASTCSSVNAESEIADRIGQIMLSDINVPRIARRMTAEDLSRSSAFEVCSVARSRPIVFTAFDGDHQHLCPYMRRTVLSTGAVPANAESILGYRDTVQAHGEKTAVLHDDLAILRGCDQLWVFTDCEPNLGCVDALAEGVLVELLYFLRLGKGLAKFVSTQAMLQGQGIVACEFAHDYEETIAAMAQGHRDKLATVVEQAIGREQGLPHIALHISDPLDFKYAHWLRSHAYDWNRLPLVSGLAIEMADFPPTRVGLGQLALSWIRLADLASEAWWFDGIECDRQPSAIAKLLRECWVMSHPEAEVIHRPWQDYPIPKAHIGLEWSIVGEQDRQSPKSWHR